MLKEVGTSGQISLGKRFAGQLFDVVFHADGRVEMLPMRAVPAMTPPAQPLASASADDPAAGGWLPPGGYAACNTWSLENRKALDAYAARIESEGTAAAQLLHFLEAAEVPGRG